MKIIHKSHIDHAKTMLFACSVALLVAACGGGSDSVTAVPPATETTGNQLATSVNITGYDSLSLAQLTATTNGTQTAMLPKLLNWLSDALVPKAYAQTVQCNYDLLKLAGVDENGGLTQLPVLLSGDDCASGFIDMYDGVKYLMFTASGIYKDGLTCNLVLLSKATGGLFCVGERSRSIYKISGVDSWNAYEKLQVSDNGNYMYLETDSSVFDENGQLTGIKTKLLRFDLSNDDVGPVASTLVEGFQQSWLSTGFTGNTSEYEGFSINGYQGLNNGDVALVYRRSISSGSTWSDKLNAFYYQFAADGTYERLKFDDTQINTLLNAAISHHVTPGSNWAPSGSASSWYDISCFFKTEEDGSFLFTIPYWYNYTYTDGSGNTAYNNGVAALLLKGSTPVAGAQTMSVTQVARQTAICSESSSFGGAAVAVGASQSVRPHKIGNTYYALQSVSGWDANSGNWGSKLYLVGNDFDGTSDVTQLISSDNNWWGSKKLHSSKTFLYLQSGPDGSDWAGYGPDSKTQPGDKLWRLNPTATLVLNANGALDSSSYLEVLDAQDSISISKVAAEKVVDDLVLTGRDLGDPDLKKVIIDIDAAGALTRRPATNTSLQPVSIVKL
jgi:hypothetical protein